ncbi:MAG TPA: hypothetical protein VLG46_16220 [Anaerolineae bacterium]|nr:hypothetical protein [Anaerolineae bacterium]
MLVSFWHLIDQIEIGYIVSIPLLLSIVVSWVVYGLQKSSQRDDEARTRATTIAIVFFVVLTLICCWLFYATNSRSIFL